mmetsp:Transcript_22828/g.73176  ORF Transcript_22828/g.73176 Transcript_22828/m.73176 type:complete len:320 (+) Transcript_22828:436-1395(+)
MDKRQQQPSSTPSASPASPLRTIPGHLATSSAVLRAELSATRTTCSSTRARRAVVSGRATPGASPSSTSARQIAPTSQTSTSPLRTCSPSASGTAWVTSTSLATSLAPELCSTNTSSPLVASAPTRRARSRVRRSPLPASRIWPTRLASRSPVLIHPSRTCLLTRPVSCTATTTEPWVTKTTCSTMAAAASLCRRATASSATTRSSTTASLFQATIRPPTPSAVQTKRGAKLNGVRSRRSFRTTRRASCSRPSARTCTSTFTTAPRTSTASTAWTWRASSPTAARALRARTSMTKKSSTTSTRFWRSSTPSSPSAWPSS